MGWLQNKTSVKQNSNKEVIHLYSMDMKNSNKPPNLKQKSNADEIRD